MIVVLFLMAASFAGAQTEASWPVTETAHFVIHHESVGANLGEYQRIEDVYARLHDELWSLTPWMATAKTDVYIYKDIDSYRRGKFRPPAWSGGLMASGSEKALAIFEPLDPSVTAHELTHLYFHAYFKEKKASPPPWLDEGLAGMLGDQGLSLPDPRLKGPILRAEIPVSRLLKSRPGQDAPSVWVGIWYQEAQSAVWFLKRGHIPSSFTDFCSSLRDGKDPELALREVYGYQDVAAFERDWKDWRPTKPVDQLKGLEDR